MTKEEFAQGNVQCIGNVWGEYDDLCTHQWVSNSNPCMESHKNRLAQFTLAVLADHVAVDNWCFQVKQRNDTKLACLLEWTRGIRRQERIAFRAEQKRNDLGTVIDFQ